MATFLTLTNLALSRLNEVLLTSGTFNSAVGPQLTIQNAVNAAIFDISRREQQWPFNYSQQTFTTVVGTQNYTPPSTVKAIKWSTFGVQANTLSTPPITASTLLELDYNEWAMRVRPRDQNLLTSQYTVPEYVIKADSGAIIISPPPGPTPQVYTIYYDAWADPSALALYSDTCTIPDIYNYVIIDGAMYYGYDFRSDVGSRQEAKAKFDQGIEEMQRELIKPTDAFQTAQIVNNRTYNSIPSRVW